MTCQPVFIAQLEASLIVNLTASDCINLVVILNCELATYFGVEIILSIPVCHMFYIDLDSENIKKSASETTRPRAKFVQIMPLEPKMAPPRCHMFYIDLYSEKIKKTSEIT